MNLLNPKVTVFFIAFFPNYIFHDNLSVEIQFTVLGIIFWIIANLIFFIVVFISDRFGKNIKKYVNSKKIKIVKAIFYLFISVWIMLQFLSFLYSFISKNRTVAIIINTTIDFSQDKLVFKMAREINEINNNVANSLNSLNLKSLSNILF